MSDDSDCFVVEEQDDDSSVDFVPDNDFDEDQIHNLNTTQSQAPQQQQTTVDIYKHTVLQTNEVMELMMSQIYDMVALLNISGVAVRLLLDHFKWKRQDLLEEYFNAEDCIDIMTAAKVPLSMVFKDDVAVPSESVCPICYVADDGLTGPEVCSHRFCTDCWRGYLSQKIFEDSSGARLECAASKCDVLMEDTVVLDTITCPKIKSKFIQAITNEFVMCDSLMRWCPAIDCTRVVRVEQVQQRPVTCDCGYQFCFGCGEFNHVPITCALLQRWSTRAKDDLETAEWLRSNTKMCPNCGMHIQKNEGCNHMTCKKCSHQFCWICFIQWAHHHACNQYQGTAATNGERIDLISPERYKHYNRRYQNHKKSIELEAKNYERVENQMREMIDKQGLTQNEVVFLRRANAILCRSRQILCTTYVFAYFTYCEANCHQLNIFEMNQRDLEIATESLSGYFDKISGNELTPIKKALQEKSSYCEQRQKALLDHIAEGYTDANNWWKTM